MMKKLILVLTVALAASLDVSAQSNELLDALLEREATTYSQAAYLALSASGRIPEDSTPAQAAAVLPGQGFGIAERDPEQPLSLGEYSYLLMQAFEMKGGLMYRIFPGPRYAARELAYLRFIRGQASPYRTFSGQEAIAILGRLLEWKEERR